MLTSDSGFYDALKKKDYCYYCFHPTKHEIETQKAEPFAQSDLQSWDRSPGAASAISEMGIGFGAANNTQRKSGTMITSIAR